MVSRTKLTLGAAVAGLLCASTASASEAVTYTYDRLGRLVKVVRDKPATSTSNDVQVCYVLDRADNRNRVKADVNINIAVPPACPPP